MGKKILRAYIAFRSGFGYIILLTLLVGGWMLWNLVPLLPHFDAPPFIVLNLLLSIEAAYAMPVFLREQYKTAAEDRSLLLDQAKRVKQVLATLDEMKEELDE